MRILRLSKTLERTGDTRSPLYLKAAKGLFTKPVKVGGARASGWPEHEVDLLVAARVSGASDAAIKALVEKLHAARATAVTRLMTEVADQLDQPGPRQRPAGSAKVKRGARGGA